MRVLIFSWEYPPHMIGGLGRHVKCLAPALAELGVEVHLVTPRLQGGAPEERTAARLTVYRVAVPHAETGDLVRDTERANRELAAFAAALSHRIGPFHIVHAHDWQVAAAAIHHKHAFKVPLLATIHATERGRNGGCADGPLASAIDRTEWRLCFEAWRIIVTSRYMADEVVRFFHVPRDKLDLIPNGVEWGNHRLADVERAAFRRRFAADEERIVFFVGRLVYEKGVHTLIAAAPQILEAFPAVRFLIAGRGPLLEELRRMAEAHGVGHRFHFLGYISDAERDRLYQVADVAVFPSLYEPFGIVVLEAMMAGAPVVVSSTGGLAEIVASQEVGLLHTPGDPRSLAQAVLHTLHHPEEAAVRVENALRMIDAVYRWSRIAERTRAVYERVVWERQQVAW